MSESGIVVVSLVIDGKYQLASYPMLSAPGLLDHIDDSELIDSIKKEIVTSLLELRKKEKGVILRDRIENCAKTTLRKIFKTEINKSPIIIVNIEEIS
jgi:ribonuclease J